MPTTSEIETSQTFSTLTTIIAKKIDSVVDMILSAVRNETELSKLKLPTYVVICKNFTKSIPISDRKFRDYILEKCFPANLQEIHKSAKNIKDTSVSKDTEQIIDFIGFKLE